MENQRDYQKERELWEHFRFACFTYEEKPTVDNWLAKQAAHKAWAAEYLRDAA